jgi:alpha-N-arabinofuranosidase
MKIRCSLLLFLTALFGKFQLFAAGPPVVASVDASKSGPPISPYVYGQFLEHAGSLVYSSLWSEMLDDRKFYYDVTNKPPEDSNAGQRVGWFRPGAPSQYWSGKMESYRPG